MGKNELIPAQREVVDHRGGALLVSAAAGSGKTRVLVERLLKRVCEEPDCDLQQFLIITFTEAAAAELREKIAKEIAARLALGEDNAHLRRQLTQLYLAQISTVHAFCANILREYAYLTEDVPADFRVADETECGVLQDKAMEQTLDEAYRDMAQNEALGAFFATLGGGRDDRKTAEMILDAYRKTQCHARPSDWLRECRAAVDASQYASVDETPWGERLQSWRASQTEALIERCKKALCMAEEDPLLDLYIARLTEDLGLLQAFADAKSWDEVYALRERKFERIPTYKNCPCPEEKERIAELRDSYKEGVKKLLEVFSMDSGAALCELRGTGKTLEGLVELIERFTAAYSRLKRQRRVLDFSDLEHEAVRLLTDRGGAPTAAARELSARFREVMVDEYQDSSPVQDEIYRAVSDGGRKLFMVGDVKQSIYRFRLADPQIFLDKYDHYQKRENDGSDVPRKIVLPTNFRSAPQIIDAVNQVFETCMSREVGDYKYDEEESLRVRDEYPTQAECGVELHCIDTSDQQTQQTYTADDDDEENDDDSPEKLEVEARFVARRIRQLLDGTHTVTDRSGETRPVQPDDIAILLRSVARPGPLFQDILKKNGIAAVCEHDSNIFDSTEIATLTAYLQLVRNPHQDIPLATAMASPIGGFTADELARVHTDARDTDLYDDLTAYAPGHEKYEAFLRRLDELRARSLWMRLTDFLDYVCDTLGFFTVFGAMKGGAVRTLNLRRYAELAQQAKKAGAADLGSFLRYVERLRDVGVKSSAAERTGAVKILSIHKSKGLEYPIVFLCDLSRKFNDEDLKKPVLFDPKLYAGCNVIDRTMMTHYPGVAKNAIRFELRRAMLSEEMRILYVGMTRAMQRLIMVYTSAKLPSRLKFAAEGASKTVPPAVSGSAWCIGDWILLAAALRPEAKALFDRPTPCEDQKGDPWYVELHRPLSQNAGAAKQTEQTAPPKIDASCIDHTYAYDAASRIPAKLTATQLKGSAREEESAELAQQLLRRSPPRIRRENYVGLSPTEQGTATHRFMQFCDFAACRDEQGVSGELARLVDKAFLSDEQAQCVDPARIVRFFTSELGKAVCAETGVRREFKFSLPVSAAELLPGAPDEPIMLQGVVDCFLDEPDGLTVVDFKTDRIRKGGEAERAELYRPQLETYALALSRIFEKPVKRKLLYFFETDTAFEL
ncbi:MAG: helicase-exonuclease AddAB subunit AddA [Oscillospiraceae bacterium]|nr:helicase-exonuclease AddAB subunit AddA [Oscillospiraceae bacterium]